MKRFFKNMALWLLAAALMLVLYLGVLYPHKLQQIKQAAVTGINQENRISELMQQKNALEQQKAQLQKEIDEQKSAPSSVFVLFSTLEEEMITETAEILTQSGSIGLMGVREEDLLRWNDEGVPGYIQERLEQNWEFCLVLEETTASIMQAQLSMLKLPKANSAYLVQEMEITGESGVIMVLEKGVQPQQEDDGLWHIPAMGNMNRSSLDVYTAQKGRGSGVAFLVGSQEADERYSRDNLVALMNLIGEDNADRMMQCVAPEVAYQQHQEREIRLAPLQEQWDQQLQTINRQIEAINKQITTVK